MKPGESISTLRLKARMDRLRSHHNKCLTKYASMKHLEQVKKWEKKAKPQKAAAKSKIRGVKPALETTEVLKNSQDAPGNQTCMDADHSDILHSNTTNSILTTQHCTENQLSMIAGDASDVPPLERTESVFLSQEYLDKVFPNSKEVVPDSGDDSLSLTVSSGSKYSLSKQSSREESGRVSEPIFNKAAKSKKVKKYRKRKAPSTTKDSESEDYDGSNDEPVKKKMNISIMKLQKKKDGAGVYRNQMSRQFTRKHEKVVEAEDGDLSETEERLETTLQGIPMNHAGHSNTALEKTSKPNDDSQSKPARRTWSADEVRAVEKTLMSFIQEGTVPGKFDCMACIEASPKELQNRTWSGIKYYINNRIHAGYVVLEDNSPLSRALEDKHLPETVFHAISTENSVLHLKLSLPQGFETNHYPLLVMVDSILGSQSVTEEFELAWPQVLVSAHSVALAWVDGRSVRGQKTTVDPRKIGALNVKDHLAAIEWLMQLPFIDNRRMGLYGKAFGGYLTLKMLAATDDLFQCAAAVAPITDFRLYSAAFSERYLGLPSKEEHSYSMSSLLGEVNKLKNEDFLIVHGTADARVHFQHSAELLSRLVKVEANYSLQLYPDEGHVLKDPRSIVHFQRTVVNYLHSCLQHLAYPEPEEEEDEEDD